VARRRYPNPRAFETSHATSNELPAGYWWYVAAGALIGFGFVDFSLIAFYFQQNGTLEGSLIPVSYALAMGAGALANFLLGNWYDRVGFPVLLGAFVVGALFTPLVFFGPSASAWIGMALWGVNKGAQDTLLKPALAPLIPPDRRSTAFGIFDTCFGSAWLIGSIAFGVLYTRSLVLLVTLSVVTQILSIPLFIIGRRTRGARP
jgi:predicted MFS family arabinose efflux permease